MIPALLCFLIAGVGAWTTIGWWNRGRRRVLAWPTVRGRIVERTTRIPTNRNPTRGRKRWEPVVRYTYVVEGKTYEGGDIYLPWPRRDTRDGCERFLATLPDEIDVRYDPRAPQSSVLFPAPLGWTVLLLAGCALASIVGLMLLVTAR